MQGQVNLSQLQAQIKARFSSGDGPALDRRNFVRLVLGTGAGLVIGSWVPASGARAEAVAKGAEAGGIFTPFVQISPENVVTVLIKHQDMGQ